jgi:prolyl-tRNA editing enzyme YbaK/EbsC (Cys-tRNA(Pro) deacylase)
MPAAGMTKTVVFLDGRHPFLVIVPAHRYVDVKRVRAAAGSSNIRKPPTLKSSGFFHGRAWAQCRH